jgi:septal ring-binding cell division protein DamX
MLISPGRGPRLAENLRLAGLADALDQVWVYRTRIRGEPLVSVLLGDFASYEEARAVLDGLAPAMRVSRPFIRNVADIRAGIVTAAEG